jgi:hypothetical protein
MKRYWTTEGNIRGSCGHKHRSHKAALDCLDRDRAGCASQGGYSDRRVVAVGDPVWVVCCFGSCNHRTARETAGVPKAALVKSDLGWAFRSRAEAFKVAEAAIGLGSVMGAVVAECDVGCEDPPDVSRIQGPGWRRL